MTVSSTTNRKTFAGNGVTTSFGTSPVVFFNTSDIAVYVTTDATGVSTLLVENTDYTITGGSGSTGTISTAGGSAPYGAPAVGTTLVIVRTLPLTQAVDLVNNDINDAEVQETALDKLVMIAQQLYDKISRAFVLSDSDVSGVDTTVPTPVAGAYLRTNVGGTAVEWIAAVDPANSAASFVQSGTGAVARTWTAKVGEILSIADFGAVGDGVTDDSAAWTAALAALPSTGGEIWIPPHFNSYVGTATYTFTKPDVVIRGSGHSSKITSDVTGGSFLFTTKAGAGAQFLSFKLVLTANDGNGIKFVEARDTSAVRDCYITGPATVTTAIAIKSLKSTTYSGPLHIEGNYITCVKYGVYLGADANLNKIVNNDFVGKQGPVVTGSSAIYVEASAHSGNHVFCFNEIEGWDRGIDALDGQGFCIIGNNYESNTNDDLRIQVGTMASIQAFIAGSQHTNWASGVGNNIPTDPAELIVNMETFVPNNQAQGPTPQNAAGVNAATSTQWQDTNTFALPPGDWDIHGTWEIAAAGGTCTGFGCGLSIGTAGNNFTDALRGTNQVFGIMSATETNKPCSITWRLKTDVAVTVLQKTQVTYSAGTPIVYAGLHATARH